MCIDYKFTKEEKEKWLKDKPETITAYKVVVKKEITNKGRINGLSALYFNYYFQRKNRIKTVVSEHSRRITNTCYNKTDKLTTYVAYYHLYLLKEEAKSYRDRWYFANRKGMRVITCKIPKELITDVGYQDERLVVVTRGFDIVGQNNNLE